MKLRYSLVLISVTSACTASHAANSPQPRRAACALEGATTTRAALADGSTLSIDPSGVARSERDLIIVGSPVYVWPRGASRSTAPILSDSVIGLIRDASGGVRSVPSPLPGRRIFYPRVATAGSRAWDVLFVTGSQGTRTSSTMFDTATVWTGRYDTMGWRDVHVVARVRTASLDPRSASALAARNGRLAFAFPFGELPSPIDAPQAPGVVILVAREGRWRQDTLRAWDPPAYVQLASGPDGAFTAAIAESYFENHRTRPQSLFLARYDSVWHPAGLVAGDSGSSIIAPAIREWHGGFAVAWQRGHLQRSDAVQIELMFVDSAGGHTAARVIGRGRALDTFGVAALPRAGLLFGMRDGDATDSLRFVLASDSAVADLGVMHIPLRNFAVIAVPAADSSAIIVTGDVGSRASDPPAWSDLTHVHVHCRRGS